MMWGPGKAGITDIQENVGLKAADMAEIRNVLYQTSTAGQPALNKTEKRSITPLNRVIFVAERGAMQDENRCSKHTRAAGTCRWHRTPCATLVECAASRSGRPFR